MHGGGRGEAASNVVCVINVQSFVVCTCMYCVLYKCTRTVGVQWCVVLSPCMQLKAWGCFEGLHQITATRTRTCIHVQGQISVTVVLVIASQPASLPVFGIVGKGWGQSAVQVYLVGMIFGTSRYNSLLFHAVGHVSCSASCHPFFVCMPDTKSFGSWFEHSVLVARTPISNWIDLIAPVYCIVMSPCTSHQSYIH